MTLASGQGDVVATVRAGLVDWLISQRLGPGQLGPLFGGCCERLLAAGIPLWRATLGLERLHPEESGTLTLWRDGALSREIRQRAGVMTNPEYLNSPTRIVDETDRPFRRRLAAEGDGGMPTLAELIAAGATDYCMLPLPFLDTDRTAVVSFATRAEAGFGESDMRALDLATRLFSPYAERAVMRKMAIDLLAAYLGPAAGTRVFHGRVERGDVETVKAAIWCCDLRGFTAMSEHLPRREVIGLLNRWFDAVGGAVEDAGGEILKFMGDGLLGVFPVDGVVDGSTVRAVCDRALDAALAALAAVERLDQALAAEGRAPLRFGLALHLGEVEFGNIGTRQRLDFTAIGPAVNHASRLEGLTKELGVPLVASAIFSRKVSRPLRRLGRFALRGIDVADEVFTLPGPDHPIRSAALSGEGHAV